MLSKFLLSLIYKKHLFHSRFKRKLLFLLKLRKKIKHSQCVMEAQTHSFTIVREEF